MTASKTPKPPKCRYCKKRPEDHAGEDHAFRTYTSKTKASSNSFLKGEINVVLFMFRCATRGQPLPATYMRTEAFSGAMRKFTNMNNSIELAERLNKIGEEQDEQQTVA